MPMVTTFNTALMDWEAINAPVHRLSQIMLC
jgi:hypothetical protein